MSRRPTNSTHQSANRILTLAAANAAMEARINGLEVTSEVVDMILAQADLTDHLEIVLLYLEMDLIEWQSVLTLREGGGEHMTRFLRVHESILTSPPRLLFLLVKKLWSLYDEERQWAVAQIKARTSQISPSSSQSARQLASSSVRTAPSGQSYSCPAHGCQRTFVKLGHAENHVRRRHHEYLELHPDYRPEQHLVSRPLSKSPQLEREMSRSQSAARTDNEASSSRSSKSSPAAPSENVSARNRFSTSQSSSVRPRQYPSSFQPGQSSVHSSPQSQHSSGNSSSNVDDSMLRQFSMMQPQTLPMAVSSRHGMETALFQNYEPIDYIDPMVNLPRQVQNRRPDRR